MKIECTLKRKGGSVVDMGDGTTYHFKPDGADETAPHVASVKNKAHIKRLMSIEGFEAFDDDTDDGEVIDDDTEVVLDPPQGGNGDGDGGDGGQAVKADGPPDFESMDDEAIAALHVEKVGRPPHPNAKRDTQIAKIMEAMELAPAN